MSLLDQLRHKSVEECEHQSIDMGAVYVGIRHDDDLIVAKLTDVKFIVDACTERSDHGLDLFVGIDPVLSCLLYIQDFAPERKDSLRRAASRGLGAAACRITLYQEDLTVHRILVRAVCKLAGKTRCLQNRFSSGELSGFSGCLSGSLRHE